MTGETKTIDIKMPEQAEDILKTLQDAGYEAYAVGGCVRDALLGREPHDWDIATSARPEEVKELFRRTIDTGLKHGTVTVMYGRDGYEITTFRIDGVYEDGRHPKGVTFTPSLEEDLKRRDFTINAMAYDGRGGLIDLFGGKDDLERGVICAVGDPVQRFSEDALRIMRAFRFSAQLGYGIEQSTLDAASMLAQNLKKVSAERIRTELEKILVSGSPEVIADIFRAGITKVILPEFDVCMETPQNTPYHCFTVGEHLIKSMESVRDDRILRLTMLLHDIGKPACRTTDEKGIDHFYYHADKSAETAETILRRLKYDNATVAQVVELVRWHDRQFRMTEPAIRKKVSQLGTELFPLLLEVKRADIAAQSGYQREEKMEQVARISEMYDRIIRQGHCLCLRDLAVNGKDLIKCGFESGREIGAALDRMLTDVINTPQHNTKEYLLAHYAGNPHRGKGYSE